MDNWAVSEKINNDYSALGLHLVQDYDKYKLYQIVSGSTQMEGATLDPLETQLLIEEGITSAGKPLEHHLMVKDNYQAMMFAMGEASKKVSFSPELLKKINSFNMSSTGSIVDAFCAGVNEKLFSAKTFREKMELSFLAHANLIVIHPWADGNKRTSRIVMNYIQHYFSLPLTRINKDHTKEYLLSLKELKDNGNPERIISFMLQEHTDMLNEEIKKFQQENKKSKGFTLIF